MQNPISKPLNPETPRAKQVTHYSLKSLYPEGMIDDIYIKPDSNIAKIEENKTLDKNENTTNNS